MKTIAILFKKFSGILIIMASIIFFISPGAADPIFKSAGNFKVSKMKKFQFPIVTVSVPLQISDLAMPWQDADIVVEAAVYFHEQGDWKASLKGVAFGQAIKPQALKSGSTQGMVLVHVHKMMGVTTGHYSTFSIAVARLGGQCKILGFGCNFQGGGCPSDFQEKGEKVVNMVIPWSDPIIQSAGFEAVWN